MKKQVKTNRTIKRWTSNEEDRLLRQVRAFPQNLHKCFLIVSEETGRTPGAVANHWYTVTSKKPENMCFFTASAKHISKNRKNGMGIQNTLNIWKKLIALIKNIK